MRLSDKVLWFDVHGLHNGLDAVRPRAQVCANPYGVPFLGDSRLRPWLDDLEAVQEEWLAADSQAMDDSEPDVRLFRFDCNVRGDDAGDDQMIL